MTSDLISRARRLETLDQSGQRERFGGWTVAIALAGVVLWVRAVASAHFLNMGADGLITLLNWQYYAALVLVCGAFVTELFRAKSSDLRMVLIVLALILILFGTASAIEPIAALSDSWIHAGFISYILNHGHVLQGYDSRFSWPGGFVLASMMSAFVGHTNALAFLRWFPVFIEAMYLAPVIVIASNSGVARRTKWLGIAIFYAADWIYQDYFSPQAMDYFFLLVVVATVMAMWSPTRRSETRNRGMISTKYFQMRSAVRWGRATGQHTVSKYGASTVYFLLVLLSVIIMAMVMSHQLTPYALILSLCALLVTSRLGRPELLAVTVLLAVGWLSVGATDYWIGHLSAIFGGVGQVSSNIGSSVISRVVGSASHRFIVNTRIEFTGIVFLIAGIGALRRATDSRALECLAGAPFVIMALQGYGGEALLRVVLFGLPFTSLLVASAILPTTAGQIRPWIRPFSATRSVTALRVGLAAVLLLGMAGLNTLTRGGNDAYESFSLGELNAVNYVYAHATTNQVVGMVAEYLPMGQQDIAKFQLVSVAGSNIPTIAGATSLLLQVRPDYIILSQSQEQWGEIVGGYPKGWEAQLGRTLVKNQYRIVAKWSTATVYLAYNQWGPSPLTPS